VSKSHRIITTTTTTTTRPSMSLVKIGRDGRAGVGLELPVGQEVAEVEGSVIGNNESVDAEWLASIVFDLCKWPSVRWLSDVVVPTMLDRFRWRVQGMVLKVEEHRLT
jgi:hypothetical protein